MGSIPWVVRSNVPEAHSESLGLIKGRVQTVSRMDAAAELHGSIYACLHDPFINPVAMDIVDN